MTQLTLDVPRRRYAGLAQAKRWWKALAGHAGNVLSMLAAYPPYSLDSSSPAESEWTRYEPASKWLEEHPDSDAATSEPTSSRT